MEQNSLQERTGSVTPELQNPQNLTAQPYQQSKPALQPSSQELFNQPSNTQIVVPASTGGNLQLSSATNAQAEVDKVNAQMPVVIISAVIVFSLLWLLMKAIKKRPASKSPTAIAVTEVATTKPTKAKKTAKKPKKKSKKKK